MAAACAVILVACGGDDETTRDDGALVVAAAFYPMEEVVRAVGGDAVEVVGLTPAGTGPHDLELSGKGAEQLERADMVVFIGRDFQPSVDQAVAALDDEVVRVDMLEVTDLLPVTPQLEGTVGEADGEESVALALAELAPDQADRFQEAAGQVLEGPMARHDGAAVAVGESGGELVVE